MNKVEHINNLWKDYITEVDNKLNKEFRKTYKFWDSLFNITLLYSEVRDEYSNVPMLKINIGDLLEHGIFYFTDDRCWSYKSGKINSDYQETILNVLNSITQKQNTDKWEGQ